MKYLMKFINLFRRWYNVKEEYSEIDWSKVNNFEEFMEIYSEQLSHKIRKGSNSHDKLKRFFVNE